MVSLVGAGLSCQSGRVFGVSLTVFPSVHFFSLGPNANTALFATRGGVTWEIRRPLLQAWRDMVNKKCEHGRQRTYCKDCGGGGLCEHGRRRNTCKECGDGVHVTVLEAADVTVEEFDGEEDEELPTVHARVVYEPRGGKRKR